MRLGIRPVISILVVTIVGAGTWSRLAADPEGLRSGLADVVRQKLKVDRFSICTLKLPGGELPISFKVTVEHEGHPKVLSLGRHSVRRADFRVLMQKAGGEFVDVPAPPECTYRGRVVGETGSLVAASLVPSGIFARVTGGRTPDWAVWPLKEVDPQSDRELHVVYSPAAAETFSCGVESSVPPDVSGAAESASGSGAGGELGAGGGAPCTLKVADIAFDTDFEWYDDEGGRDSDTCVEIIETGLNITNLIYIRDVKITHRLTTVVIRSDPETDFYAQFPDGSDFGAMLSAFRNEWNANMGNIDRDVAYLLTSKSRPQYGGLAWVSAVCTSYHYGMGIGGWGYHGIFRHEVGHNWGAGHSCGTERRYIMCGNSIDAISAYNIRVMTSHRDSRSCLEEIPHESDPEAPFVRLDRAATLQGDGPIPVAALEGDTDFNCDQLRFASHDARSAFGAEIKLLDPVDPGGPEALLYTPRSAFLGTDYVRYSVADGTGFEKPGVILVEVRPRAMIVHLTLDEAEDTDAADSSGYGHDGELRDDLSFTTDSVPGKYGNALKFSGIDGEYVSLGDESDFDLRRGLTVAAWFRVDAFNGDGETIISKGGSAWRLKRDGTNRTLKFTCSGLSVSGSSGGNLRGSVPVDDGMWHHAAGVYDGNRIYLYVDGELDNSLPATGFIGRNSDSLRIGDNEWNGVIDDVRVYNYGLTESEIRDLYQDNRVENPSPADGAIGFVQGSAISWLPAPSATHHDVYVGTDRGAVAAATPGSPEYMGRRTETSYSPRVDAGTTYFWRIDEVSGGAARRGAVRSFTTSFAFTNFDEPPLNARSYHPGPGDAELGFETVFSPTSGDDPYVGVIETGSTPTTPIFSHRSVDATTTFDAVDLSENNGALVSLILQARNTGYEEEDSLEVYVTDGARQLQLLQLRGGADLTQRAGTGYATFAATIPREWEEASLVVSSSSNSGSASERYDFDSVGFSCHKLFPVIAFTNFSEPAVGAVSYTPGPGSDELGFETDSAPTSGADPFVGVVEAGTARLFSQRSVNSTTTFETVDLRSWNDVRVTVVLRVRDTGYEGTDSVELFVTNDGARVDLLNADGDTGLDDLADDEYIAFWATIPDDWDEATLVAATSSNSSAGSERYDFRTVEFVSRSIRDMCGDELPPPVTFRRGDANADGNVDLSDGVRVLNYLFLGGTTIDCLDAADTSDSGTLDISDGVLVFNYLFLGAAPPAAPGPDMCGPDPTEDTVSCESFPICP